MYQFLLKSLTIQFGCMFTTVGPLLGGLLIIVLTLIICWGNRCPCVLKIKHCNEITIRLLVIVRLQRMLDRLLDWMF